MSDVTNVLQAAEQGDPRAAAQLLPLIYDELRSLAAQKLAQEKLGQTLDATALVHEAYLRLLASPVASDASPVASDASPVASDASPVASDASPVASAPGGLGALTPPRSPEFANRRHFFAAAAEAMRRILIENARRKHRLKRGGDRERVKLSDIAGPEASDDLLALDAALTRFAVEYPAKAELVKLRYFAGLSVEDAAGCVGISRATADRWWAFARAWLYERIQRGGK